MYKVYEPSHKMAKYIGTLAVLYENFEQAYHEKKEAEQTFDRVFPSRNEWLYRGAQRPRSLLNMRKGFLNS